jgi:predicted regulator of Ras-like GTPase activity (Roadblock/LC7/MglB family)
MNSEQQNQEQLAGGAFIRERLDAFAVETRARRVILLDVNGYVIGAVGSREHDEIEATLGPLLTGIFASARQMAAMLGEPDLRAFFQLGAHSYIYTVFLPDRWLLVTLFDRQANLGLVRMLADHLSAELAGALADLADVDASVQELVRSAEFQEGVDMAIDQLFYDESAREGE